jgi:predicted RNA binding protein YcfA (HicA-like mRNA interferase family)
MPSCPVWRIVARRAHAEPSHSATKPSLYCRTRAIPFWTRPFVRAYMHVALETSRSRIRRRLEEEGWYLDRHGANHDTFRHPTISGIITLPRHNTLSTGRPVHRQEGRMAADIRMNEDGG